MWHLYSPPFRTPYSRLIGGILIRVVPFLAHLYSMQVLWEGHYRWYRIESKIRTGVFDNGRGKAKGACPLGGFGGHNLATRVNDSLL